MTRMQPLGVHPISPFPKSGKVRFGEKPVSPSTRPSYSVAELLLARLAEGERKKDMAVLQQTFAPDVTGLMILKLVEELIRQTNEGRDPEYQRQLAGYEQKLSKYRQQGFLKRLFSKVPQPPIHLRISSVSKARVLGYFPVDQRSGVQEGLIKLIEHDLLTSYQPKEYQLTYLSPTKRAQPYLALPLEKSGNQPPTMA